MGRRLQLKKKKVKFHHSRNQQLSSCDLRGLDIYFYDLKVKKETTLHLW